MGSVEHLIGSLLSAVHGAIRPPVCRNDWLSTVSMLGAIIALLPVLAAILIALIRKGIGNRYNVGSISTFGVIGVVCCLAVPWLAFRGASGVMRNVAIGGDPRGLTAANVASIGRRSCLVDDQRGYLANHTVYSALTHPQRGTVGIWLHLALLVGAPLLCLLLVLLQSRIALRRGQKWPGVLLWLPLLGLAVATGPLRAGVVGQLWLGFVPVSAVGLLVVFLIGTPRWSVINRSAADRSRPQQPPPVMRQPVQPVQSPPPPAYHPPVPYEKPVTYEKPIAYGKPLANEIPPVPANPVRYDAPKAQPQTAQLTGAAATTPMAADGRFARVRTLGSGGFGTVWLAMDTHLDRTVAVKFAHVPDADTEQRIRREAKALAAVRHPNCVRIYDIVAEPDGLGIVMEYIDGPLLADVVKKNGLLDDVAAARLWVTMAGALEAAHAQGVLHRDVKPSNVIVDNRGAPHLIDFGIARSAGDSTLTGTGMMVGTPDYLAPEIARNGPPTPAADCWQLAATVSYALSGKPPRGRRPDLMAAMMAAAAEEPCRELPGGSVHARLLAAALDNDPARRPSLATIRTQVSGWLARSGNSEDGPIASTDVVPETPATQTLRH